MSEIPTLPAYREGRQLAVWCEHEAVFHWHGGGDEPGDGDGHRVAHCACGPLYERGYYLREVGPLTREIERAHKAVRRGNGARTYCTTDRCRFDR